MTTLEMILVTPILLIVLVVSVQFGVLILYQAAVTHATTVAAREAAKGADLQTIAEVVQAVVRDHGVTISDASGSGTRILLDRGGAPASPFSYGDDSLVCPAPSQPAQPGEVRVTACVDLSATRFSDVLAPWGLSFAGRTFRASSFATMELDQDGNTP